MKKIILGVIIGIVILTISYVIWQNEWTEEKEIQTENINKNAKITTVQGQVNGETYTIQNIEYVKEGKTFKNYFDPDLKPSLNWIKNQTAEDSIFLCWWDYGHMIRGYTDRDVVIYSPSEDILWTLASKNWDTEASGEFSSREKIDDVVNALTTHDPEETRRIMDKYDANYIFVTRKDREKSYVLFTLADYNLSEYLMDYEPTDKALDTVIFKIINENEIEGFELVYSDEYVKIYR